MAGGGKRGRARGGGAGRRTRPKLDTAGLGDRDKTDSEQIHDDEQAGEQSGGDVEKKGGDEVGESPPSGTPNARKDSELATDSSELTAPEPKKKKKKNKKKQQQVDQPVEQSTTHPSKEATDAEAASADKPEEQEKLEAAAGEKPKDQEKCTADQQEEARKQKLKELENSYADARKEEDAAKTKLKELEKLVADARKEEEAAKLKLKELAAKMKLKEQENANQQAGMPDAHKEPAAADMTLQVNLSKDMSSQVPLQPSRLVGSPPPTIQSDKGTATLFCRDEDTSYSIKGMKAKRSTSRESGSLLSGGTSSDSSSTKTSKRVYKHSDFIRELQSTSESTWVGGRKMEHQRQDFEPGSLPDRFKRFLERYLKSEGLDSSSWPTPGVQDQGPEQQEQKHYYKELVLFMVNLGSLTFEVDFVHIMNEDIQLAMDIVKKSAYQELQTVACAFAMEQVSSSELKEKLRWTTLKFVNRPKSIVAVADLLEDPAAALKVFQNMLGEGVEAANLSELVMALFAGFAEYIFETNRIYKRSWGGNFNITHMFVIDHFRYVIVKKPDHVLEGDEVIQFIAQKNDLRQLPAIFTPFLDCRQPQDRSRTQPPKDLDLPLFYPQLRDAIEDVTQEELKEDWFPDYIIHFPALKPPIARHDFVCDSYLALKQDGLHKDIIDIISWYPCEKNDDWRRVKHSNVLQKVYTHKEVVGQSIGSAGNKAIAGGSRNTKDSVTVSVFDNEPFTTSTHGIITYDRHLRQHGSEHAAVKSTIAEVDAFASARLLVYLHNFLKRMLSKKNREEKGKKLIETGDFRDIWMQYKASRIRTTDGSELKPGSRSCWM